MSSNNVQQIVELRSRIKELRQKLAIISPFDPNCQTVSDELQSCQIKLMQLSSQCQSADIFEDMEADQGFEERPSNNDF